jgi:short-subunit dehydrogenase
MFSFANKVVVITGAANGLGRALAREFYSRGCHLALFDTDAAGLASLKVELSGRGNVSIHEVDVSVEHHVLFARNDVVARHSQVDVLINNAAISSSETFKTINLTFFRKLFDVNFWGAVYCTKHFLQDLSAAKDSRLANVISGFAAIGFPGKSSYGSSKSALMGLTQSLYTELIEHGVKVSMVIPPAMDTGLIANGRHIADEKKNREIAFAKANSIPLNTVAKCVVENMARGKFRIVIGRQTVFLNFMARVFPVLTHRQIIRNKGSFDFI